MEILWMKLLVILEISLYYGIRGDPSIGVAVDPVDTQVNDNSVGISREEEDTSQVKFLQEPLITENQEISSPGHVIVPEQHANFTYGNDTFDPQESGNMETPPPDNNVEIILLSIIRMGMNNSGNVDNRGLNRNEDTDMNGNHSELSYLYGTYAYGSEMTTASGIGSERIEEGQEKTTETAEKSQVSHTVSATAMPVIGTKRSHNNESSSDRKLPSEENTNLETNQHETIIFTENNEDSTQDRANRLFFFDNPPPFVAGGETGVSLYGNESNHSAITILEPNTNRTTGKITFIDSRAIIPGKNLLKEISVLDAPDVHQFLSKCGVFPACRLHITKPFNIVNSAAHAYRFGISEVISSAPSLLRRMIKVTCDPTSVSIVAAFAIVLAIIIVISNIVIIWVTLRTRSLRKPHGYFKISLAVADFLTGAFVLTSISSNMVRYIYFNESDINQLVQLRRLEPHYSETVFFGICAVLSQVVTVYSVLLLSIDSFLSIRWPMQYRVGDLMTPKRSWGLITAVWVFAFGVSALPILAYDYVRYGLSYSTFSFFPILDPLDSSISSEEAFLASYIHVILYALLVFGIPFLATWTLTLMTAYHSRGMLKQMDLSRKKPPNVSRKIGRLERDIQRTVTIVLVMLTITVLPIVICLVLTSLTTHSNPLCLEQYIVDFIFASYYILVCGSFLNVIVYNSCHKEFRRATFDLLCDVVSKLFGRIWPELCDLRLGRTKKSTRSKSTSTRTRRTTMSAEMKKEGSTGKLYNISNNLRTQTNVPIGLPIKGDVYYEKSIGHSDSVGSEVPSSSSGTLSTDESTSSRNRSTSSDSNSSVNVIRKIPAQRAASCSSVFTSSNFKHTSNAK